MKKIIILFFLCLPLLIACKKDRSGYDEDAILWPPNKFFFQLIKPDGEQLSSVEMDSLKFFYINTEGERQYYNPMEGLDYPQHLQRPSLDNYHNLLLESQGVLFAPYVNGFGVVQNTWYFEQMDGRIDTLYVESRIIHSKDAGNNPCGCIHPFSVVRLNGKDATIHPNLRSVSGKFVFVLKP